MSAPAGIYRGGGYSLIPSGFFRATGEFRAPRKGEFYLSGAIVEAYPAPNDLSTAYWIAVRMPEPPKTIRAHGVTYRREP